jgi:multiple antibiotic resistance protein
METVAAPLAVLFGLLFTLVGPIKMIPTFHALTAGMDARDRSRLALKAAAFGALGIALAALMGLAQIESAGISREALGTAAGLVLAIVGLLPLIGMDGKAAAGTTPPDALSLAFPVLLPPHAFGLILLISLYIPSIEGRFGIVLVGFVLMALNAVAMLVAGPIMKRIGMTPLRIFGAVFGIIQLALGIQILFWGLSRGFGAVA